MRVHGAWGAPPVVAQGRLESAPDAVSSSYSIQSRDK